MPHWFEYEKAHGILRCRVEGIVDDLEVRTFYGSARKLSEQLRPNASILDLSDVTKFAVSKATIQDLAQASPAMGEFSGPRIIVAPRPDIYGLVRMFQAFGERTRPNLRVLRQSSEAYAELGVPAPEFAPVAEPR